MIVLHFSLQKEDLLERTNDKCHVFIVNMQEADILEHINGKCHLCTL